MPPSSGHFPRVWIIGFAGHRRLPAPDSAKAAIVDALKEFRDGIDGIVVGRTSAAAGADLLFLEACRELGVAYSIVLPFPTERFREDFESPEEWARVESMLAGAAHVSVAPGHQDAPEAYHLAAREILDVADAMIFLWDGLPARGIGGTAESVDEARERGIPHRIIPSAAPQVGPLQKGQALPWNDPTFSGLPRTSDVASLFDLLDRRAVRGAPRSRWFAAGSISLNQMATVIYAVLVAFGLGVQAAPAVRFAIVTFAAILPWVGARIRIHESWVEDRLRAELLRSLLASHAFAPPLRPVAAELFSADAPFLRSAAWQLLGERKSWEVERDRYLRGRLDNQIDYLSTKGAIAARRLRIFSTTFRIASVGAMTLGAVAIAKSLAGWSIPDPADTVLLKFLPMTLPAIAAWCLAMIPLFEHKRRAVLYRQLEERLRAKRAELAGAKCSTTAASVVASCERLLLTELWEWGGSRGKRR